MRFKDKVGIVTRAVRQNPALWNDDSSKLFVQSAGRAETRRFKRLPRLLAKGNPRYSFRFVNPSTLSSGET